MELQKAQRKQAVIKMGLQGPSGSGKTYSALLLAYGLVKDWDKVVVLDSENHSADLYAHLGDYSVLNNGSGTNSSGFSALPAGFRNDYGMFSDAGKDTHFCSSTEYINNTTFAFNRKLSYNHSGVGWFHAAHYYGYPKNFGFSVRCVK